MIKRASVGAERVKVTFAVPASVGPVSVVGDFNDWSPASTPLRARSNGTRSAAVVLSVGQAYRFRYLDQHGGFFDDEACDALESNGYGQTHGVLRT